MSAPRKLDRCRRVVVKLGSSVLTENGAIRRRAFGPPWP